MSLLFSRFSSFILISFSTVSAPNNEHSFNTLFSCCFVTSDCSLARWRFCLFFKAESSIYAVLSHNRRLNLFFLFDNVVEFICSEISISRFSCIQSLHFSFTETPSHYHNGKWGADQSHLNNSNAMKTTAHSIEGSDIIVYSIWFELCFAGSNISNSIV